MALAVCVLLWQGFRAFPVNDHSLPSLLAPPSTPRVYRLHERLVAIRTEYNLRLKSGSAPIAQATVPVTQRPRQELEDATLRYLQDLLAWVEENQRRVAAAEWGIDLPTVESQLGSHRGLHQSIEEFRAKIERARADEVSAPGRLLRPRRRRAKLARSPAWSRTARGPVWGVPGPGRAVAGIQNSHPFSPPPSPPPPGPAVSGPSRCLPGLLDQAGRAVREAAGEKEGGADTGLVLGLYCLRSNLRPEAAHSWGWRAGRGETALSGSHGGGQSSGGAPPWHEDWEPVLH